MTRRFRAVKAVAASTRTISAGGLAGIVAVYAIGDYPQVQLIWILLTAILIGSTIEYVYLEFEDTLD